MTGRCRARSSSAVRASPGRRGGVGRGHRSRLRPARRGRRRASVGPLGGSGSARIEETAPERCASRRACAARAARDRRRVPARVAAPPTAARRRSSAWTTCCAVRIVPAGTREVEFTYAPWSWTAGWIASLLAALALAAWVLAGRRRSRVPAHAQSSPRRRAPRAGQQPRQARTRRRRPHPRDLPGARRAGRSMACRGARAGTDRPRAARVLAERRGRRAGRDLRPHRGRGGRLRGVRRVRRGREQRRLPRAGARLARRVPGGRPRRVLRARAPLSGPSARADRPAAVEPDTIEGLLHGAGVPAEPDLL